MNAISQEFIEKLLHEAKEEHTKKHGNDPNHDWVPFYAEYIRFGIIQEAIADLNVEKYVMQNKRDGKFMVKSAITHEVKTIHDFSYDGRTTFSDVGKAIGEHWDVAGPQEATYPDNPVALSPIKPRVEPSKG